LLSDILIAFAVVGAIGLTAGILLTVISKLFSVEENQQVKDIRACLPGINCGVCGFKGCDDYAAAIADGSAKPNLCVPGAAGVAERIGNLLGIEIEAPKDVVAFVHCDGNCTATAKKADYSGIMTCRAASMLYSGPDACRFGCMGYGDCAAACPTNAICVKDGIAHVDTSKCLGCGLCAETCPKKVIFLVPQETAAVVMCNNKEKGADARKACKNACIACKKCEKNCASEAIKVINNLAVIDYGKCSGCGLCVKECPTHTLKSVFLPDLEEEYEF